MAYVLGGTSLNSNPRGCDYDNKLQLLLELDGVFLVIQHENQEVMHMKLTQPPLLFVSAFNKVSDSDVYDIFPFALEDGTVSGHFASRGVSGKDYILVEFRLPKYQEVHGGRDRRLCDEPLIVRGACYTRDLGRIIEILAELKQSDEIMLES